MSFFDRLTYFVLLGLLLSGFCAAGEKRPNIILVFIDDMGWADFSCFGNEDANTPNIDRLANEGIRFEQFYVNSPFARLPGWRFPQGNIPSVGKSHPTLDTVPRMKKGAWPSGWILRPPCWLGFYKNQDTRPDILGSGTWAVSGMSRTPPL